MSSAPTVTDNVADVGTVQIGMIDRSWARCRSLGLTPEHSARNEPVPASKLQRMRERHEPLLRLAGPELDMLFEAMTAANGIVLLTDPQGLILDARGDTDFLSRARRVALLPGARWSEAREGTNAIGTALEESALVEVLGCQHFLQENQFLVCTAMPVQDPTGQTAGVLDLSADVRNAHPHARMLLRLAITNLEHRWVLQLSQPGDHVVQLHPHPAWLNTPHEGVMVFRDGELIGGNRSARWLLGLPSGDVRLHWSELFSEPLQSGECCIRPRMGTAPLQLRVRHHPRAHRPPARQDTRWVQVTHNVIWDETTEPLRRRAERALIADVPLLLHGETGTGKELFVRALHRTSARAQGPLVAINCAAVPEALFEAELFGYASGAFTGARRGGNRGRLREAHQGILFLDEIGDMPMNLQGRLLRVLQDREVQPLGGQAVAVDFLLVAATHKPLDVEVAAGRFRADLYYRLQHLTLTLPPLRERPNLPAIIDAMLQTVGADERGVRLSPSARERLLAHDWPGNFRELANLLRTLVALSDIDSELQCSDLPAELQRMPAQPQMPAQLAVVPQALRQTEQDTIRRALRLCKGNISAAARHLGIHRTTLHRKLKQDRHVPEPGSRDTRL